MMERVVSELTRSYHHTGPP